MILTHYLFLLLPLFYLLIPCECHLAELGLHLYFAHFKYYYILSCDKSFLVF